MPAIVRGGNTAALTAFQAINNGSLVMNAEDFTGLDFSSATSFADVASTLQTALRAGSNTNLNNAVVTYNAVGRRFEVTTGTTVGATATLTLASAVDPATGTDVSSSLGLSESAGGQIFQQGAAMESVEEALNAIRALNPDFYFITLESSMNDTQTVIDVSNWVAPQPYMFSAESNDNNVLTTAENVFYSGAIVCTYTGAYIPYMVRNSGLQVFCPLLVASVPLTSLVVILSDYGSLERPAGHNAGQCTDKHTTERTGS